MSARFRYSYGKGDFASAMASIKDPIAAAGTGAIKELADIVKREGRQDMASAGFSKRFQNTFRGNVYPAGRNSIDAAAVLYSKVRYSNIFETGGTISGKPRLWLPLPTAPTRAGRQKMTPALYVKTIGPLISIERQGKPPLLAGKIATNRRGSKTGKVSLSALKRGGAGAPSTLVPLFVGIDRVSIKDKLHIREITERAAGRLGELYFKHLNPEG
ncbi:DUF6441 family protein [Mesorhizobium cantuariense]|uniref:DUF6441 family protein n=1 Tax=Mesorhizobium cantuariense TaxID=1300275 RepID=A0ABV7MN70_9HYPH